MRKNGDFLALAFQLDVMRKKENMGFFIIKEQNWNPMNGNMERGVLWVQKYEIEAHMVLWGSFSLGKLYGKINICGLHREENLANDKKM